LLPITNRKTAVESLWKWHSTEIFHLSFVFTPRKPGVNVGLFCKIALWKRRYSAKETYSFKEPTNRSHPIYSVKKKKCVCVSFVISLHMMCLSLTHVSVSHTCVCLSHMCLFLTHVSVSHTFPKTFDSNLSVREWQKSVGSIKL